MSALQGKGCSADHGENNVVEDVDQGQRFKCIRGLERRRYRLVEGNHYLEICGMDTCSIFIGCCLGEVIMRAST